MFAHNVFQPLIHQMGLALTGLSSGLPVQTVLPGLVAPVQAGMQDSSLAEQLQPLHSVIEQSRESEIGRDRFVTAIGATISNLQSITDEFGGDSSARLLELHQQWQRLSESTPTAEALARAAQRFEDAPPGLQIQQATAVQGPASVDAAVPILEGGVILVADDEEQIRRILARILQRAYGLREVLQAKDGAEAWELFQQRGDEIGLLVTDSNMPNMGGPELAQRVRERSPHMPVLLISGYSLLDLQDRTSEQIGILRELFEVPEGSSEIPQPLPKGISFMIKPFTPDTLKEAVRLLLESEGNE